MPFAYTNQVSITKIDNFGPHDSDAFVVGRTFASFFAVCPVQENLSVTTGSDDQDSYYNAFMEAMNNNSFFGKMKTGAILVTRFPQYENKFLLNSVSLGDRDPTDAAYLSTINSLRVADDMNLKSVNIPLMHLAPGWDEIDIIAYQLRAIHDYSQGERLPFEVNFQTRTPQTFDNVVRLFLSELYLVDVSHLHDNARHLNVFYVPEELKPLERRSKTIVGSGPVVQTIWMDSSSKPGLQP